MIYSPDYFGSEKCIYVYFYFYLSSVIIFLSEATCIRLCHVLRSFNNWFGLLDFEWIGEFYIFWEVFDISRVCDATMFLIDKFEFNFCLRSFYTIGVLGGYLTMIFDDCFLTV